MMLDYREGKFIPRFTVAVSFTPIAMGPSICMVDEVAKSRKKKRRTENRNRTNCPFLPLWGICKIYAG